MASTNGVREIRTRLSLDGETAFRKSLKSIDSSLTVMRSELKNVSTSFDDATDSMTKNQKKSEILQKMQEQLKVKVDALSDAVETSSKAYEEAKKKAENLTAEYGENSDEAKAAWQETEKLANKMDRMTTMSNNAKAKLNDVTQQLRNVETALENAGSETQDTASKFDKLSSEISNQEDELNSLKTSLVNAFLTYGDGSKEVMDLQDEISKLSSELNENKEQLSAAEKSVYEFEKSLENAGNEADTASDKAKDAADGGFTVLKGAAADLVSDGLSKVYDSLKNIVTEFGNADSVYNNFAIKTGSSAADMEKYSQSIMGLYKEGYGDSLSSISDGMAIVKQSMKDVPTDKLEEVTEYALTLEDAFGYDVAESMRAANSLVNQFGVSFSDAYDLIIQGAQNGLDQNGDLLDVINEYSVQFKNSGHGAEDMFNMLANGAATGVWSVDKLGDAWKEFNIRVSDGTADKALQALGLGFTESAADAQLMERAALNVSKAEISLSEAHKNANEALKDSGENSAEYQKALISVKEAEYALADAESAYSEAANATSYNLDEIKGKLASGGTAAQEAQHQIINALMSVEDENERYILGQELMGTMWEDLGEEAVSALFDTQGEISTTKDAMQEVIDLQYEDIGSKLEKVGRKAKTEIAEPLIKKYLPKIEDGIEWVSENLDDIIPTIETIGKVTVTAFAAKKIYDFGSAAGSAIKGFVTVIKGLTTATNAQAAAQTVLNATNPWGWVTLAVAGVGALTYAIIENYESYDDMVEKAATLTEEEQKIRDSTQEVIDKFDDWKDAQKNITASTDAEFNYYQNLWDELQGIVDQNGKIKEGYEERADFITNKLSGYTDMEIQITDGVIQKYGELSTAIEDVMQKKKAESYLSAYQSSYEEALTNEQEAYKAMLESQNLFNSQLKELDDAKELEASMKEKMDFALSIKDPSTSATMYNEARIAYDSAKSKVEGLTKKIYEGVDGQKAQIEVVREAEKTYSEFNTTIKNFESLDEAIFGGDMTAINIATAKIKYGFKDITTATKEELEEQRDNLQVLLSQMEAGIRNGMPGVTQESINQVKMLIQATNAEIAHAEPTFNKNGKSNMQSWISGLKSEEPNAINAANTLANSASIELWNTGADGCSRAGQYAGECYANGLQSAVGAVSSAVNSLFDATLSAASFIGPLPHFAKGTDNFRGGFAVINEGDKGELVNLPDGSQVIPHDISMKYAEEAAARGSVVNNSFGNINIQISNPVMNSGQDVRSTAIQLSEAVISEIAMRIDSQKKRYSSAIGR